MKTLANVDRDIDELGGLAAYQRMSSIGQGNDRGGGSEKVLILWLREMGMPSGESSSKLRYTFPDILWCGESYMGVVYRLLEVGALKDDNYRSCTSWIDVCPMDLRSRHPSILEQDFLLMDSETEHHEKWDIISLSLVLNFVPQPRDRGS
jgi:25S rRNA (adenine2142-N1)-methyltransferase